MAKSETTRGFSVYDTFTDQYGVEVRVQESSSVMLQRVWIFSSAVKGIEGGAIHLDVEGVDRLIAALQEWKEEKGY